MLRDSTLYVISTVKKIFILGSFDITKNAKRQFFGTPNINWKRKPFDDLLYLWQNLMKTKWGQTYTSQLRVSLKTTSLKIVILKIISLKIVSLKICQFENMSVWKYVSLKICQFRNLSVWKCISLKMYQFENLSIWKFVSLKSMSIKKFV